MALTHICHLVLHCFSVGRTAIVSMACRENAKKMKVRKGFLGQCIRGGEGQGEALGLDSYSSNHKLHPMVMPRP